MDADGDVHADPLAVMSYRDATARASELNDPNTAAFQLQRALQAGDDAMARATAQTAVDYGWINVVNQYTAARPDAGAALEELQRLTSGANSFVDALPLVTVQPTELSRLSDDQLTAVANGDTVAP